MNAEELKDNILRQRVMYQLIALMDFQTQGRGVLTAHVEQGESDLLVYVPRAALEKLLKDVPTRHSILDLVDTYNPKTAFVVVIFAPDATGTTVSAKLVNTREAKA